MITNCCHPEARFDKKDNKQLRKEYIPSFSEHADELKQVALQSNHFKTLQSELTRLAKTQSKTILKKPIKQEFFYQSPAKASQGDAKILVLTKKYTSSTPVKRP